MSHQTGTIKSFDQRTGFGYLSCNETNTVPVVFNARQVDGLKSLAIREPVSYELIQEAGRHTPSTSSGRQETWKPIKISVVCTPDPVNFNAGSDTDQNAASDCARAGQSG